MTILFTSYHSLRPPPLDNTGSFLKRSLDSLHWECHLRPWECIVQDVQKLCIIHYMEAYLLLKNESSLSSKLHFMVFLPLNSRVDNNKSVASSGLSCWPPPPPLLLDRACFHYSVKSQCYKILAVLLLILLSVLLKSWTYIPINAFQREAGII